MGLKLIGEVALDGSGFERGLHKIGAAATENLKSFVVGAFGLYGIEEAIRKTVETAEDLVNESKRLDVTVEQLQLLRQAAKDGGTEMATLAKAFEKMDLARTKALKGDKGSLAAFKSFGITPDQLKTETAASLFIGPIANRAKNANVESLGTDLKEILGKGFGEVLPVLRTDMDELHEKMKALGLFMSADTAVQLKNLGDEFNLAKQIIIVQFAPALIALVDILLNLAGQIKGAYSFWDTVSSNIKNADPAKEKPELLTSSGKINFWKKLWDEVFEKQGKGSAVAAYSDTLDSWDQVLKKMNEELMAEAEKLKNPRPVFTDPNDIPAAGGKQYRAPKEGDALVRVGNFLGSSTGTINTIAAQQVRLQREGNGYLKAIATYLGSKRDTLAREFSLPGFPM